MKITKIKHKNREKKQGGLFSKLFGKKQHLSPKKALYWVLEEVEETQSHLLVKFYNFQDKEIYQEEIYGTRTGFLDDEILHRIREIEKRVLAHFY